MLSYPLLAMLIHHNCHSVYRKMSDFNDILKYVAYMDIAKYALIKIGDMLTILVALLLLLATNTGFSVYLLVMRSDEANKVEVSL